VCSRLPLQGSPANISTMTVLVPTLVVNFHAPGTISCLSSNLLQLLTTVKTRTTRVTVRRKNLSRNLSHGFLHLNIGIQSIRSLHQTPSCPDLFVGPLSFSFRFNPHHCVPRFFLCPFKKRPDRSTTSCFLA